MFPRKTGKHFVNKKPHMRMIINIVPKILLRSNVIYWYKKKK